MKLLVSADFFTDNSIYYFIAVPDEDEENEDHWPKGFSRLELPKYEKILGWDKQNPLLKYVIESSL